MYTHMSEIKQINERNDKEKKPPSIKANNIYARAAKIERIHKVAALGNTWLVSSGTVKGKFYCISFDKSIQALRCECKSWQFNQFCKHLIAVSDYEHGKGIVQ